MSESIIAARISADAAAAFAIAIDAPRVLPSKEYFRFALQYYARVLYELAARDSVRALPEWVTRISEASLDRSSDLFAIAGAEGALSSHVPAPVAKADIAMRVVGLRDREISGDLSTFDTATLASSVIAVVQSVLPLLPQATLASLPSALANMNASYELTHQYADPESQRHVPSVAYLAAAFV